ncbi:anthranilate synthase component I family protein [Microaerobacter geothermalis]|uniref:anthranilate synthase component I family protein n=1 Tax=Microaerobacter geothermalis TaxID=674972 RepID=UPI001F16BB84|nr:anthranilate synthase component I family protein [Microaerobacter geothermalis]MCF6094678.1 anthranilate synthase component I family protein [Microaerobacter geothermalis]
MKRTKKVWELLLREVIPQNGIDPVYWFKSWAGVYPHSFLLESGQSGRYTYIGKGGGEIVYGKNKINTRVHHGISQTKIGDPFSFLQSWMKDWSSSEGSHDLPWTGGAVGYFSYDMVKHIENIQDKAIDDLLLPDFYFMVADELIIVDHKEQKVLVLVALPVEPGEELKRDAECRLKYLEQIVNGERKEERPLWKPKLSGNSICDVSYSFQKDEFEEAVRKVQNYISAGDVFQVNLSLRRSQRLDVHPFDIYCKLREINPSPYMGYLSFGDFQLVCGSPELLVRRIGDRLVTRPIAGTRRRGDSREEDLILSKELIENEKERAEHIMLVDLERNDLGKVSRYGSVQVTELMAIEEYSHVMHIVSQVEGILLPDKTNIEIIKAFFPGGTITGAPKVRTMEIIEELEKVKRGIYTGSIGWIGYNGNMEMNIVIRTLIAKNNIGHVQAGAGIVIDSEPEKEYYESLKKGQALWKAVELSVEENRRVEVGG